MVGMEPWDTSIPVMTDCLGMDVSHGLMTDMNNRVGKKHLHRQNRTDDQQLQSLTSSSSSIH
jgi:hypothetical protein